MGKGKGDYRGERELGMEGVEGKGKGKGCDEEKEREGYERGGKWYFGSDGFEFHIFEQFSLLLVWFFRFLG